VVSKPSTSDLANERASQPTRAERGSGGLRERACKGVILIRKALQTSLFVLVVMLPPAGVAPAAVRQEPATLVVTNGRILTVEDSLPEAQAVAVRGDRIVALGSAADIRRYIGTSTEVKISSPPIVGVPAFVRCVAGPS